MMAVGGGEGGGVAAVARGPFHVKRGSAGGGQP